MARDHDRIGIGTAGLSNRSRCACEFFRDAPVGAAFPAGDFTDRFPHSAAECASGLREWQIERAFRIVEPQEDLGCGSLRHRVAGGLDASSGRKEFQASHELTIRHDSQPPEGQGKYG